LPCLSFGPGIAASRSSSDRYVAVVAPAEARLGDHPSLVSLNEDGQPLAQPRLVVDGDVKGGCYVSGVVDLAVGQGALW